MRRTLVATGLAIALALFATSCASCASCKRETPAGEVAATPNASPNPEADAFTPSEIKGDGQAMGTHLAFAAFTTESIGAERVKALFDAATAEIVRLEKLMTTWDPNSEVSRINSAAGVRPVLVGVETFAVIKEALRASTLSDGAFDITFQTLHGLWKFDEDLDAHPPTPAQVASRLRYLGYQHVKLDPVMGTVFLDESHVRIGLGGIAKGYAVDAASKVLRDGGLRSFYVQAGGDLFAKGAKPDGSPWVAGVRDPRGAPDEYFADVGLVDQAFSTAGDYERSYIVNGRRYHHIIDPHTGYPATASRSVTIWAPTALLADEIDDGVFILGPEKGLALVESLEDVGAVIVDSHNHVWISKRLQGRLHEIRPPTDGL
jgi:FAD:protein FMN transferase